MPSPIEVSRSFPISFSGTKSIQVFAHVNTKEKMALLAHADANQG